MRVTGVGEGNFRVKQQQLFIHYKIMKSLRQVIEIVRESEENMRPLPSDRCLVKFHKATDG